MEITNRGEADDALLGASVDGCQVIELHDMFMDGDVMIMRPVEGGEIPIPAGETVALQPGGLHVMCIGKEAPLELGSSVEIALQFRNAGPVTVVGAVVEPGQMSMDHASLETGEGDHEHEDEQAHEHDQGHHHHAGGADPHVWFSVGNVEQWVRNAQRVLSELDPANSATYEENAAAYLAELASLADYADTQMALVPESNRFLVTNHDSFGYLADDYGFTVLGTVIPVASTLAEPSASDLASLIEEMEAHGVCTLFIETTVSDTLARTVAAEVSGCDQVRVLQLYTGALGPDGSGADSYIGMFRFNVDTIVQGLN
jgi:copper(I)-binding protein